MINFTAEKMAFTFSKATDYPSTFEDCKALTLELMSSIHTLRPFSIESIQVQFTLRVMKYRLAKFACPLTWDPEVHGFVKSFEYSFPDLSIVVSEKDLRHKLCSCISDDVRKENIEKAAQLKIQMLVNYESVNTAEQCDEESSEFISDEEADSTSVQEQTRSDEEMSTNDCNEDHLQSNAHDELILQFGDVDMRDFESDDPSSDENSQASSSCSENTICHVISDVVNSADISITSALKTISNVNERAFLEDPVSEVQAAWTVYHRDEFASPNEDDITEVAVIHRKSGLAFEIRDERRKTICAFDALPTAVDLAFQLKPLCYSNKQIWRIYYLMRGRTPIPIRSLEAPPSLVEMSLLATSVDDIGMYLL